MENKWKNMSIDELDNELKQTEADLVMERRKLRDDDKYKQARAQRDIALLKSKKAQIEKAYNKQKKEYKLHKVPLTDRTISMYEIDVRSKKYYGESFRKVATKAVCTTLVVAGFTVAAYNLIWNVNQMSITESQKNEEVTKEDNKPFWDTTEGRDIQKYSAMYGVDPNLAMNIYLNRDKFQLSDYCQAYNISDKKYDDIYITSNDHTQVTKGICGQLAQALEVGDGNVVLALALCEQGYENITDLIQEINRGNIKVDISSYSGTINSKYFNTNLVQKVLANCPTEITNYYYDNGEISVKELSLQTGEESKSTFVDDLSNMHVR